MDRQHDSSTAAVPLLILGLGWTGQFLVELLRQLDMGYAATTRNGRNGTIPWELGQHEAEINVASLPAATTVLVTFPVVSGRTMTGLMDAYEARHGTGCTQWILLSSTRVFSGPRCDRHGPIDASKDTSGRMHAEAVVLARGGTVLHLAGLWGAQRHPRNWVPRFATADKIRAKLQQRQLHLVHGYDVARAIVQGVHPQFDKASGQRWVLTDGGCCDWLQLFLAWGSHEQVDMVRQLAPSVLGVDDEQQPLEELVDRGGVVRPRLDSTEFWTTFGLKPSQFLQVVLP